MAAILRKYNIATTILFPLLDRGLMDFDDTPVVHAAGDSQISKDEGAFANTANGFVHEGNGIYSLALTIAEMGAARIVVTIVDQGAKSFEDQAVLIETYGHASAQHAFDLDLAEQTVALSAQGKLDVNAEADTALTDYDAPTDAEMTAEHDAILADTVDLQARVPAALVGGRMDSDVGNMQANVLDATALAANAILELNDALMRMTTAAVEAGAGGVPSHRTLYGIVAGLMHLHERDAGDNNIILYQADDATPLVTIPITKDSALDPIKKMDPPA